MSERILLLKGDITRLKADAIVNAANSSLMGGGGVDGAIHRAGGPAILEECRKIIARQGSCQPGEAVITTGGKLPARFVIHTEGPVWNNGKYNEAQTLANCYNNCLSLATNHSIATIAFPNISTGIYGYPKEEAARTAINTVTRFLSDNESLSQVSFVCFDEENYVIYQKILDSNFNN